MRVVELYDEGYTVAVSIDLRHYFDTIPQDLLMTLIRKTVRDLRFTERIKRFLKSGVAMPDGLLVRTEEEAPQGGPLSPLLANIYREILTLLIAPLLAKVFGPLAPISSGGATTMDTTLPIISQTCGQQYVVVSLFHGFVVDFSVPFLVTMWCML